MKRKRREIARTSFKRVYHQPEKDDKCESKRSSSSESSTESSQDEENFENNERSGKENDVGESETKSDENDNEIETDIKNDNDVKITSLVKTGKLTDDGEKIKPLYHLAIQNKSIKVARVLLPLMKIKEAREIEKGKTALHIAAEHGVIEVIDDLLENNPELQHTKDEHDQNTLHKSVKHMRAVKIFLRGRVVVNKTDKVGRTPLSYAAENGELESTKMLLEDKADQFLADNQKMKPIHYAAKKGHTDVFRVLVKEYEDNVIGSDTDSEDEPDHEKSLDQDVLDLAISNGHEETVSAMFELKKKLWMRLLRSRSRSKYNKKDDDDTACDTPMRKLIREMPNVAWDVFTKLTVIKSDSDFEVKFHFKYLDDTYHLGSWKLLKSKHAAGPKNVDDDTNDKSRDTITETTTSKAGPETIDDDANDKSRDTKTETSTRKGNPYTKNKRLIEDNHPLMIMVKYNRTELLRHPLVAALLKRKWTNIGLYITILNFLMYAGFLFFLTGFALSIRPPYLFKISTLKDLECSDFATESIPTFALYAKYGVLTFTSIELLIEVLEIVHMFHFKVWNYLRETENVLEWITGLTAFPFVVNITGCYEKGYRQQWQWTCGVISVFLAWINMLMLIRKFDWFGIYVVMMYRVIKMFIKFFLVFSFLIVAFSISFHLLFQNQEHFKTVWISMMKTTTMMIGGPDFETTFLEETVHFEQISYAFFYIFMLLMAIVVINLLVGLTVDNIQEFQKRADISKKKMQVKFALNLERIATSNIILRGFVTKRLSRQSYKEKLKPNKQNWLVMKFSESWKLTERHIKAALETKTQKSDTSKVISQLDTKLKSMEENLEANITKLKKELLEKKVEQPQQN